jgi:hypothetical protein
VRNDFYPSLDLEAAKVAYLVDSDPAGESLMKRLMEHGVPKERIVVSPTPGVENLLSAYSGPIRPLIPFQIGHPFRFIPATSSG